jgi:hypothetical protein
MEATAQCFTDHATPSMADAMRDAAAAAADHSTRVKRTLRAIFSFVFGAAISITRWLRARCHFGLGRR